MIANNTIQSDFRKCYGQAGDVQSCKYLPRRPHKDKYCLLNELEKSTGLLYYRIRIWVVFCLELCDKLCDFVYHKDTEYP